MFTPIFLWQTRPHSQPSSEAVGKSQTAIHILERVEADSLLNEKFPDRAFDIRTAISLLKSPTSPDESGVRKAVEALDKLYKFTYGVLDRRRLQFKPEEYGPMKEAKEALSLLQPLTAKTGDAPQEQK